MQSLSKRLSVWFIAVMLVLLIPFIAMQFTFEVNWTAFDFIFAFIILFGSGLVYELITRRSRLAAYRAATGLAVLASLFLVWVNGAVGIIGNEGNPLNMLYFGVIVVGIIGACIARFRATEMSYVLFVMTLTQMLVPVIAFIVSKPSLFEAPGIVGVFALNAFFALLFVSAGLLFRQAGTQQNV